MVVRFFLKKSVVKLWFRERVKSVMVRWGVGVVDEWWYLVEWLGEQSQINEDRWEKEKKKDNVCGCEGKERRYCEMVGRRM